ncbi:SDR family oxidoreductase [Aureimonas fodinaquatilis]|uniref:SDR family oxidoreductase n=1 Tax=Aureimonas fodinaquatilis TaxID=2565783 RepID=A0A5B0DSK8_9HYPH|nr:SDR family oxidoreductase [Aureimonas fodinaquatilis]KAA0969373.1 SDR family oxidoreductase [Aureimonas fodinaquatilis]
MSTDRFSLAGKRALVTGASSGIGRAVALGLAEQGASLVVHHFSDQDAAEDLARLLGGQTPVLEADFTQPNAAAAFADQALNAAGDIDILIWNAAIERRGPWNEVSPQTVADHVAANFAALLTVASRMLPPMTSRGWGRVVATGSIMATRPRAETIVYAAMKSAQLTAVRSIAREVASCGVTMNVVSPGAIEIEANADRYADQQFRSAVASKIPAGRPGRPEDLVGAYIYLCSDAAAYVTGADIPVNGGWSIGDAPVGQVSTPQ